jgi:hypothetical protein
MDPFGFVMSYAPCIPFCATSEIQRSQHVFVSQNVEATLAALTIARFLAVNQETDDARRLSIFGLCKHSSPPHPGGEIYRRWQNGPYTLPSPRPKARRLPTSWTADHQTLSAQSAAVLSIPRRIVRRPSSINVTSGIFTRPLDGVVCRLSGSMPGDWSDAESGDRLEEVVPKAV